MYVTLKDYLCNKITGTKSRHTPYNYFRYSKLAAYDKRESVVLVNIRYTLRGIQTDDSAMKTLDGQASNYSLPRTVSNCCKSFSRQARVSSKISGLTYKCRAKWKGLGGIYSAIYGEVNV
jgi:hypothetical protein